MALLFFVLCKLTLALTGSTSLIVSLPLSCQGHKKATVMTKKESKEKREIIEESKENLKAKSDDSGEEKNGDDDSQKNGPKKKGECGTCMFAQGASLFVVEQQRASQRIIRIIQFKETKR